MNDAKSKRARALTPTLIAVAVLGAAFGGFTVAGGLSSEESAVEAESAEEEVTEPEEGEVVEIGQLTVSLDDSETRYARVGLAVVLDSEAVVEEVEGRFPLLKDAAVLTIADRSPDDLRSREGLEDLKASLSKIAGDIYPDGEVLRVILVEAIVA